MKNGRIIEILLIEDDAADSRLILETLKSFETKVNMHQVQNGVDAIYFLNQQGKYKEAPKPDIIILDIKLPNKDGFELLKEIKQNEKFKKIPVVVLTSSDSIEDINKSYLLHANCYITKPIGLDEFIKVMRKIEDFWLNTVQLPE
ncbi:MAG: response regulator [Candidatus Goldbacteria bacterium]|nr:response regulator [Candidatus Goldiibacteriota bacterium]